ncbi:MAG: SIS domain-containing protein [Spirochaetia bacterium]|jgi:D-sedoheptulose 7-phosphate isomerase|nr:SIS domain-containing protein [Spirochaetia bacterium]
MNKEKRTEHFISDLILRYPVLSECRKDINEGSDLLITSIKDGGKFLICGNGGSSADADHIVGELMKGFIHSRPLKQKQKDALKNIAGEPGREMGELLQQGIPAISLSTHASLITAFLNDVDPSLIFAQQVMGLGKPGDVLWGISTSGNAKNVTAAAISAKAMGLKTFALTGSKDSSLSEICDVCIQVKETETYKIQELHLPVYHTLCMIIENYFFA